MVAKLQGRYYTVEEYLAAERLSEVKHEYIDGYLHAMAGAKNRHTLITGDCTILLGVFLRSGPCLVMASETKVRVTPTRFLYPDLLVTCDPRDKADESGEFVYRPKLIIEVLSPSTANFDRGRKFAFYQDLESLEEYVLVETTEPLVHCYRRRAPGHRVWEFESYRPGEEVVFSSIGFRCPIEAIYQRVTFTEPTDDESE